MLQKQLLWDIFRENIIRRIKCEIVSESKHLLLQLLKFTFIYSYLDVYVKLSPDWVKDTANKYMCIIHFHNKNPGMLTILYYLVGEIGPRAGLICPWNSLARQFWPNLAHFWSIFQLKMLFFFVLIGLGHPKSGPDWTI